MSFQKSRFLQWIDHRVRVTIHDGRMLVGTYIAYDKHMNLVLADTDEYRQVKHKKTGALKEIKRTLGLVILRGENVLTITVESPPTIATKKLDLPQTGKSTSMVRGGVKGEEKGPVLQPMRPMTGSLVMPKVPLPQPLQPIRPI